MNELEQLKKWLIGLVVLSVVVEASAASIFWYLEIWPIEKLRSSYEIVNFIGLRNEALKSLIEILKFLGLAFGGIVVILNTFYSAKRSEAFNKNAETALENTKIALENIKLAELKLNLDIQNLKTTKHEKLSERFIKAVEQLSSEKITICLGGIYSLEKIAEDSESSDYKSTVLEVLSSFVREASIQNPPTETENETALLKKSLHLRVDIQTALRAIGKILDKEIGCELTNINVGGAALKNLDFQTVSFAGANLRQSLFFNVNLRKAKFTGADLQGALFRDVNFNGADISLADFQQSVFVEVDLGDVQMIFTDIRGANLKGSKNLSLRDIKYAIGNQKTSLPSYLLEHKEEIYLSWAKNAEEWEQKLVDADIYRF
uniref:pentapeptide repeat-containing protein n=1 Tax=Trichocoleus desertorum TaxID=1481672 RepID=UPI0025B42D15|nr:pentapeptide repeat-containing protein [Trichocoleus desertorum]